MSDEAHDITVIVQVKSFGEYEKCLQSALHIVAREVALQYGDENVQVRAEGDSTWFRYDRFGDDMGHHPGHDQPLLPLEGP